jgi:4-hydroxy-tetrahydrodipicolinate reductase
MTIKILVNGAFGRMGQLAIKTISENPKFELVGQTGREYDLPKSIKDSGANVVVDFTHPNAVFNNATLIIEAGAHPVIGTSGLKREQINTLEQQCAKLKRGAIIAPNFSLGAVLMMKCAKQIARYLPQVEIIELHHPEKADSPSGTAMRTAELIAESISNNKQAARSSVETIPGARGATYQHIPIHSVRLPGFLAHQQVIFGGPGETLTVSHNSMDRQCFMPGIALACEKVVELDRLVYGLEEVL